MCLVGNTGFRCYSLGRQGQRSPEQVSCGDCCLTLSSGFDWEGLSQKNRWERDGRRSQSPVMGIYKHVHTCACMWMRTHVCALHTYIWKGQIFETGKKEEHLGLRYSSIVEFLHKMRKEGPGFRSQQFPVRLCPENSVQKIKGGRVKSRSTTQATESLRQLQKEQEWPLGTFAATWHLG